MFRIACFLLILILPVTIKSQQAEFFASTDATEIILGSYVEVRFTLKNVEGNQFTPPSFKDFVVLSGPNRSSSMRIINGNVNREMSISYSLQPKNTGTYVINSASINTENGTLNSNPVRIRVIEGNKNSLPQEAEAFIETICSDSLAHVGQQITLSYKLYTRLDVRSVNFASHPQFDGFYAKELGTSGERTKREIINGVEYATKIVKRFSLFPQQKGAYQIDPVAVNLGVSTGDNSRSFFFSAQLEPKRIITRKINILVDEIPRPVPESFSGAIGEYFMDAGLAKRTVSTDEAIIVKMNISGDGDSKTVMPPTWIASDSFDIYDPNILEDEVFLRPEKLMHKKSFEYLIIPKYPGQYKIKPEFSFYNPDSSRYITLSKDLPPVNVIQGQRGASMRSSDDNRYDLTVFEKTSLSNKIGKRHWQFWHILGIVIFLLSIVSIIAYSHYAKKSGKNDPVELRRKKAMERAITRLQQLEAFRAAADKKQFYEELTRSLKQYLSDKHQIPAFHISIEDIEKKMLSKNIVEADVSLLKELLKRAETALYAPGLDSDLDNFYDDTLNLITRLES